MAADDSVSHGLIAHLRDKIRTNEAEIQNCDTIIRCLTLTTLRNGTKRHDPQTGAEITTTRRDEMYDIWTVKARTLLGLPDPTPTPPPGNAGQGGAQAGN